MTISDVSRIVRRPVVTVMLLAAIGVIALFGHGKSREAVFQPGYTKDTLGGGPDPFGYSFKDSHDFGGPPFAWISISTTGNNLELGDDSNSGLFPIGFDFVFYGVEYNEINVSSEGNVTFGSPAYVGFDNVCIPGPHAYGSGDYPMIAGFWDDIQPTSVGNVYYDVRGTAPNRRGVVAWEGFAHPGGEDTMAFEIILNETDNSVLLQYSDVDLGSIPASRGGEATTGIQDYGQSTTFGLQYSCDQPELSNSFSILFSPGSVFHDGFETGDTNNWSRTSP